MVSDHDVENHLLHHCLQVLFDPARDCFVPGQGIALRVLYSPLVRVVVLSSDNLAK